MGSCALIRFGGALIKGWRWVNRFAVRGTMDCFKMDAFGAWEKESGISWVLLSRNSSVAGSGHLLHQELWGKKEGCATPFRADFPFLFPGTLSEHLLEFWNSCDFTDFCFADAQFSSKQFGCDNLISVLTPWNKLCELSILSGNRPALSDQHLPHFLISPPPLFLRWDPTCYYYSSFHVLM